MQPKEKADGSGKQDFNKDHALKDKSSYIRHTQKALLHWAIASWPRRNANLIEINCGSGRFSRLFWSSGFDIISTEPDSGLRLQAQNRNKSFLEVRACADDDLPFEEDRFDWAVLHTRGVATERLEQAIREVLRVARNGGLITFWNSASIAAFFADKRQYPDTVCWRTLYKIIRKQTRGRITLRTTLWEPAKFWGLKSPFSRFNDYLGALPFGAWGVMRLDFGYPYPVTPLALNIFPRFERPQAAMEYTQKH